MNKIIPTILLTSVFWIVIYLLISPKKSDDSEIENIADYSEEIIGEWQPTEMSDSKLIFSKYGTMRIGDSPIDCNYSIDKDVITISLFNIVDGSFRIKIYTESSDTYLEIFEMPQFAGKYIKVDNCKKQVAKSDAANRHSEKQNTPSKPDKQEKKSVKMNIPQPDGEKRSDLSAVEKTVPESDAETKPEIRPAPEITNYSSAITGKWQPVEGAKNPLEFSKYGTVIQWLGGSVDMRYEYSLNGNKLDIGYDNDAKVIISNEGSNTYLEIYNSKNFSGKYILSKKAPNISTEKLATSEYMEEIAGKWEPIFGAKETLEFSKYGTVIQWLGGSVDMRYEYSLSGNRLNIGYDSNAKVVISQNATNVYLEIYNSKEFSGLYRKL